jgi:membrane protease YdiL (CAAX protease family)
MNSANTCKKNLRNLCHLRIVSCAGIGAALNYHEREFVVSTFTLRRDLLAAAGLVLAFGFVLLESLSGLVPSGFSQRAFIGIAVQWLTTAVVGLIAVRGLGLGFRDLGVRLPRLTDWLVMVGLLLASIIAVAVVAKLLPDAAKEESVGQALRSLPLSVRILLVITAGTCEEFLFRGYGIEVISRFTKNRWLAGVLTLFFFTIAHAALLGWTAQLVVPCLLGAFLTLLYLLRGNLVIAMVMHTLIDAIGIILVPLSSGG